VLQDITSVMEKITEEKTKRKSAKEEKVKVKKLTKKQTQIIECADATILPNNYIVVWTEEELSLMCSRIDTEEFVALDTETLGLDPFRDEIVGISIWLPTYEVGYYVPLKHRDDVGQETTVQGTVGVDYVKCLPKDTVTTYLKPSLERKGLRIVGHNYKFDAHVLFNWLGISTIHNLYFDTTVASALLDENKPKKLKELYKIYMKEPADRFTTLFGKETFDTIPILLKSGRRGCLAGFYAIKDAYMTWALYEFFNKYLNTDKLKQIKRIMFEIEMPVIPIVWKAESKGIRFDTEYMINDVAPKIFAEVGICPKCKGFYSINGSVTPKTRTGKYKSKFYFCECGIPDDYKDGIAQKIWRMTGEFNLKSNPQLAGVLFGIRKFPQINKKKPESADKKTLRKIRAVLKEQGREEDVLLVDLINSFRSESKLADAFADKLPNKVLNGRIHTSFNTVGAKTFRFSSSGPNLQQMPSKVGGLIRRAFMADEGRLLLSCDFSGQELRILAHVSKCPVLKDIYDNDGDVHSMTATGIYNKMYSDNISYEHFQYCRSLLDLFLDKEGSISDERLSESHINKLLEEGKVNTNDGGIIKADVEKGKLCEKVRKNYAKALNFGIVYGITEKGISDNLSVSEEEAVSMIASFMHTYPGVKKWIDDTQRFILKNKYSMSMCGGKRRLYELIDSGQKWKIGMAFRQGVNAVIQRSAAEMTKLASIKLQPLLEELDSMILLWVHDELIMDVPMSIGMDNIRRISEVMCNALPLCVPMKSDAEVGDRWSEKMDEDTIERLRYLRQDEEDTDEEEEDIDTTEDD
jgi:DNA polymerase-1